VQRKSRKNMIQEIDRVRCAIDKLAEAVRRAEQRSLEVERSAQRSQEAIACNSAQVAIKAWMGQCVETIERSVWLNLETKVEAKVRSAIEKAMGDKVDLIRLKQSSTGKTTSAAPHKIFFPMQTQKDRYLLRRSRLLLKFREFSGR